MSCHRAQRRYISPGLFRQFGKSSASCFQYQPCGQTARFRIMPHPSRLPEGVFVDTIYLASPIGDPVQGEIEFFFLRSCPRTLSMNVSSTRSLLSSPIPLWNSSRCLSPIPSMTNFSKALTALSFSPELRQYPFCSEPRDLFHPAVSPVAAPRIVCRGFYHVGADGIQVSVPYKSRR